MLRHAVMGRVEHGPGDKPFGLEGSENDPEVPRLAHEASHVFEQHRTCAGHPSDAQEIRYEIPRILDAPSLARRGERLAGRPAGAEVRRGRQPGAHVGPLARTDVPPVRLDGVPVVIHAEDIKAGKLEPAREAASATADIQGSQGHCQCLGRGGRTASTSCGYTWRGGIVQRSGALSIAARSASRAAEVLLGAVIFAHVGFPFGAELLFLGHPLKLHRELVSLQTCALVLSGQLGNGLLLL